MFLAGAYDEAVFLDMSDGMGNITKGFKKDAENISKLLAPHMERMDPDKTRCSTQLLYYFLCNVSYIHFRVCMRAFDSSSNTWKASKVMCINFPRVACIHGVEHVMTLLFDDVIKLEECAMLVTFFNCVRKFFDSACHLPAAMIKKYIKDHDNHVPLSLIKIAETRMGGKITFLFRLLRLRHHLAAIIH